MILTRYFPRLFQLPTVAEISASGGLVPPGRVIPGGGGAVMDPLLMGNGHTKGISPQPHRKVDIVSATNAGNSGGKCKCCALFECNFFVMYLLAGLVGFILFWSVLMLR